MDERMPLSGCLIWNSTLTKSTTTSLTNCILSQHSSVALFVWSVLLGMALYQPVLTAKYSSTCMSVQQYVAFGTRVLTKKYCGL